MRFCYGLRNWIKVRFSVRVRIMLRGKIIVRATKGEYETSSESRLSSVLRKSFDSKQCLTSSILALLKIKPLREKRN